MFAASKQEGGSSILSAYIGSVNDILLPDNDDGKTTEKRIRDFHRTHNAFPGPASSDNFAAFNSKLPPASAVADQALALGLGFSVLKLEEDQLVDICVEILLRTIAPVLTKAALADNATPEKLRTQLTDLVKLVQNMYTDSAYHNFYHAVDRVQLMYTLVSQHLGEKMEHTNSFYLVFICLCLDIGNPYGSPIDLLHRKKVTAFKKFKTMFEMHIEETEQIINAHPVFSSFVDSRYKGELLNMIPSYISLETLVWPYSLKSKIKLDVSTVEKGGHLKKEHMLLLVQLCELVAVLRPYQSTKVWSNVMLVEQKALSEVIKNQHGVALDNIDELNEILHLEQDNVVKKQKKSSVGYFNEKFFEQKVKPLVLKAFPRIDTKLGDTLRRRIDFTQNMLFSAKKK